MSNVNKNEVIKEVDRLIYGVEDVIKIDNTQLKYLNRLEKIMSLESKTISNDFNEYSENYNREGNIIKKGNKGGPVDNWFERVLRTCLNKNDKLLDNTYENFNEFVVPDIVNILPDCVLCVDGKTNNGDGDSPSHKIHLGVNQSTLNDVEFNEYVSNKDPREKGDFKGRISPFYKGKPCLTYIVKIVYYDFNNASSVKNMNMDILKEELKILGLPTFGSKEKLKERLLESVGNSIKCKEIQIFLIPHIDTYGIYKKNIKRGGNKSGTTEQRLEINDKNLVKVIKLD